MEIFHKGSDPPPPPYFRELWNRCYTFDGVCRRVYQMCSVVMDWKISITKPLFLMASLKGSTTFPRMFLKIKVSCWASCSVEAQPQGSNL